MLEKINTLIEEIEDEQSYLAVESNELRFLQETYERLVEIRQELELLV